MRHALQVALAFGGGGIPAPMPDNVRFDVRFYAEHESQKLVVPI
jgi:hypothetical protein